MGIGRVSSVARSSPLLIPGVTLSGWWMAGAGVHLNGSTVSQLDDQSGNGVNLTQGTPSAQPTSNATGGSNNQAYLAFTAASSQVLKTATSVIGTVGWTIFSVHQFTSLASNPTVMSFGAASAGNNLECISASNSRGCEVVGVQDRLFGPAGANWEIWVATNDGVNTTTWANGLLIAPTNRTTNASSAGAQIAIGMNSNGSAFMQGNWAEGGASNQCFSLAQVTELNRYLGNKYAIAGVP